MRLAPGPDRPSPESAASISNGWQRTWGTEVVRIFIRHTVADYAAWRTVYDDFDATRRSMGVTGAEVYQALDNRNDVTVWHDFGTRAQAEAFAGSSQLRDARAKAGVQGQPVAGSSAPRRSGVSEDRCSDWEGPARAAPDVRGAHPRAAPSAAAPDQEAFAGGAKRL